MWRILHITESKFIKIPSHDEDKDTGIFRTKSHARYCLETVYERSGWWFVYQDTDFVYQDTGIDKYEDFEFKMRLFSNYKPEEFEIVEVANEEQLEDTTYSSQQVYMHSQFYGIR